MLSPRAMISLTSRSISAGGACGSIRVRSNEGFVAASAGEVPLVTNAEDGIDEADRILNFGGRRQ
jgi:hypothetical protein